MNVSKQTILLIGALTFFVVLAGYFFFRSTNLKEELAAQKQLEALTAAHMQADARVKSIDSVLMERNYRQALRSYNAVLNESDSLQAGEIQWRIDLAQQLLNMELQMKRPDTPANVLVVEDTIQTNTVVTPKEIRTYDSLLFVLEKTEVQLQHLKRQVKERSMGTYLTFKSKKGNPIHYVGEVNNGKANGQGIALLSTGSRYVGTWKDNMRHGEGTFYWPDGEFYEGSYQNDIRHGQGTYHWPTGEKYTGEWRNDQRNGEGTFFGVEGEIVAKGTWKNDEFVKDKKKVERRKP